ncbi:MAG: phenylacetic acid degradation bifunctional protein PaaZ, partial [Alphaproteobacteria bacterium]
MSLMQIHSFAAGRWVPPDATARPIESAVTGEVIAKAGSAGLDMQAMLDHAQQVGGPALRAMGFHDRARMLKALAIHLNERRDALYELSFD